MANSTRSPSPFSTVSGEGIPFHPMTPYKRALETNSGTRGLSRTFLLSVSDKEAEILMVDWALAGWADSGSLPCIW